jgi:hypothetical protein
MQYRTFLAVLAVCAALLGVFVGFLPIPIHAQVVAAPTSAPGSSFTQLRSERLGITFINSAQIHADDARYANALSLGAGWNRYPVYWDRIEQKQGEFTWDEYDKLVIDDTRNQLQANAILLGMPAFYRENDIPMGINEPIFADNSDFPKSADSPLNPANPWANFVYKTVMHYKPGGTLAQEQGWQYGQGIRVWEVWNEPDFKQFWSGSINAYARLLKTAYIVIKMADPAAQVMFGGLLYPTEQNWLAQVLAIYINDPQAEFNNYYFDIVGVHSYSYPWRSGWLVLYVRETLDAYKLKKEIWLNESGVSVWDDYPGPTWTRTAEERLNLATADQQAWYFIQSSAYAWSEGANVVFFHQLYDDCGDQAAGTNFPPHNGEYCANGNVCWGNAFGLYRNESNAICFSQSPLAGSPRPVVNAYRLVAQVFGTEEFVPEDTIMRRDDGTSIIRFNRPRTQERISVIWNRRFTTLNTLIEAEGSSAQLYTLTGNSRITPDISGNYTLTLGAAQEDAYPFLEGGDRSAIGGAPVILIEKPNEGLDAPPQTNATQPSDGSIQPTIGALPTTRPTAEPSSDTEAPRPNMAALAATSGTVFKVAWGAEDNGEVVKYLVWVRVDGGDWIPWLETSQRQADYSGEAGKTYEFAVWAQDAGGNWSANTDLQPMAVTRVNN